MSIEADHVNHAEPSDRSGKSEPGAKAEHADIQAQTQGQHAVHEIDGDHQPPPAPERKAERVVQSKLVQQSPASRPMLSRVAEQMYWMSRYVERAEHIARIVLINSNMLIDLGELAPDMQEKQWLGVLRILRLDQRPEVQETLLAGKVAAESRCLVGYNFASFMARESSKSIIHCVTKARENARSIRENISAEMWETLNTLYWSLTGDDVKFRFEEYPQEMFLSVIMGSMLFQGVADQTLPHAQSWQFIQLAKYLERADMICRIVDTNFDILQRADDRYSSLETPLRNIQWMGMLRSCCSIEAYQRKHLGDLDPLRLATFLLLDAESPRNVRYSVNAARTAISGIAAAVHPQQIDAAERILGRLNAHLEYAEPKQLSGGALSGFLKEIQVNLADASIAIENAYFLH
ncbi:MAG: alpha-E domain-containing protein [Cyanobacteria bacterium REEB67]|nr:alpha-E domain-containing protein [Cyanobacteria bacterium REEB67]